MNSCSNRFFYVILMACALLFVVVSAPAHAVGFRWIEAFDLRIGVWYPSPTPETEARLGPFDAVLAVDAAPATAGRYQVVLFSHGNLGRPRNHHLTAKALAEAGFIVVAPLHSADHLMAGKNTANAVEWRTTELRFALEAVMQDAAFRSILDLSRIHALGYSLGAIAALNAAGASIDLPKADAHCVKEDDPAFCETPSWFWRWRINRLRDTTTPTFSRDIDQVHYPLGFVNGGVATVAPLGQGFGVDANSFRGHSVLVIGLKDDVVVLPQFHAVNIADSLKDVVKTELHMFDGHHSAFIAPFAKRVTDVEDIPAAKDPEGFDRLRFLSEVNALLVDFFSQAKAQ